VSAAAARIGVSRTALYNAREADAAFAAMWDDAVEAGVDRLEDAAFRRAVDGVEEPVFFRGQQVGTIRRYSDALLIALLKAKRPGQYRESLAGRSDNENLVSFFAKAMEALENSPPASL
jgi:hypothetical protein